MLYYRLISQQVPFVGLRMNGKQSALFIKVTRHTVHEKFKIKEDYLARFQLHNKNFWLETILYYC